ncbi:hypothetical protein [Streptomyces lanatus]|uniref:Transposase n=1 Tax=Streptomyces lanatus TaxID=66900 RepID=A0ABV1XSY2_9ACTN|nr:hypothetical protein [Streptomyces lanatus]GHH07320.1 hypothetical protein GCM10018780_41050 [Streptomyces lanatus]
MHGERTPAEQALGRSYTTVDRVGFNITRLTVEHHADRTATLTFGLTVQRPDHPDETWVVTLPWDDKSFVDVLTSPAPHPDRLRQLVHIVHALLEEWWDTKGRNRKSAKMGRQIS